MIPAFRSALGSLLLASSLAPAVGPYQVGPVTGAPAGAANDLLGYAAAARAESGNGYAAFGALLGRYVVVYRLAESPQRLEFHQHLGSPSSNDDFGEALALDHAVDRPLTLIVGANVDDQVIFNAGRVYVYRQTGASLALVQQLVSPAPVSTGNYGTSVALDGDWLSVGEPKAQVEGSERGAVHLYRWQDGAYVFQSSVTGTELGGRFGQSVALRGADLVVGAVLEDDHEGLVPQAGAVYVYRRTEETWTLIQRLLADDRADGDRLGVSVALDGDTLIAGAANDDELQAVEAGSAYVYGRSDGTWCLQAKLRSSQPRSQERFGQSVAVQGKEVLVGAYCAAGGGCLGTGAVEVHVREDDQWKLLQRIEPALPAGAQFGHSLALAGRDRVVVGAFNADGGSGPSSGAVFLLTGMDALFYSGMESQGVASAAPDGTARP